MSPRAPPQDVEWEDGAVGLQFPPEDVEWTEEAGAAQPPPRVGAGETFALRGAQALPAGGLVTDLLSTGLLSALRPSPEDVPGVRATLPPQARAELEAMGEQVAEQPGLVDTYRTLRDTRRLRTAAGSEQNPWAGRAGTAAGIAASALAPFLPKVSVGSGVGGRVGSAALTGAAYGALSGATDGDADLTRGEVGKALEETATGAALGAGLGALGGGAAEGARLAAPAVRRLALSQGKRVIQGDSTIAAGTQKALSDEAVEEILKSGGIRPLSTTQATAQRIETLAAERGKIYGEILDDLERMGVQGPQAKTLADRLYQRYLEEYPNFVSSKAVPNIFKRVAGNVEEAALPGPPGVVEGPVRANLGLRQTEAIKQELQNQAKFQRIRANPSEDAYREIASTVRQANENAIEQAAQAAAPGSRLREVAERFNPVKAQLARTLDARHFARPGASKAEQRSTVGLKDVIFGAGAAGGDPVTGLALTQASSLARNRLPSTVSSEAFALANALRSGAAAGNVARGVAGAAEMGLESTQDAADAAELKPDDNPLVAALVRALRRRKGN